MRNAVRTLAICLTAASALSACANQNTALPPADASAPSESSGTRTTPVVPGRPARVFIMAAVGKACEQLAPPEITITAQPAKGDVSFTPGQDTNIATSAQGTCIGTKTKGMGIYYTARAGATGTDAFAISAKLATGETATRSFTVTIAE
jgi:predicted small lipoprotein YifL